MKTPIFMLLATLCLFASSLHAQALPAGRAPIHDEPVQGKPSTTRVLADFQAGTASGLGYHLPDLVFGLAVEQPLKNDRWEAQGAINWSPDRKYITGDGNTLILDGRGIFWLFLRHGGGLQPLGLTGGVTFSKLWTSQFDKHLLAPSAGFVVRDNFLGAPGRLYLDYFFPTGCQWATTSNPCTIQSNREHGIEFYQDVQFYSHWRIAMRGSWVRAADQGNQNQPMPRVWHDTGTFAMVLRYQFRGTSTDVPY